MTSGPLAGIYDEGVFPVASVDGKVVLVPHTADVTNVIWYNRAILEANGVTPPTTWEELLAACDTLNAAGVIPIASGNKDLWAAGNWLSHLASRVSWVRTSTPPRLRAKACSPRPSGSRRSATSRNWQHSGCVNESVNAVDDNAGAQLFFQGQAAMHPIGSWLVSWAIDENPDLDFDFVNLPAMPEGSAGNQDSVIGVSTGHMVNANSENIDLAIEFLALVNSPENVLAFINDAGLAPLAESASAG